MDTAPILYRTRPQPSGAAIMIGLLGFLMLVSGSTRVIGLLLIAGAVFSWRRAEIVLTARYLKVRRGLSAPTNELQLVKLETIQTGTALGSAKPLAVVGTGGTVYRLGTIPNAQKLRDKLQDAIENAGPK